MIYFISDGPFPNELKLGRSTQPASHDGQPRPSLRDVRKDYQSLLPHHSSEFVLTCGNVEFCLRMGLRWRDELHWWEWVRLETLWTSSVVSAYRVGGSAQVYPLTIEDVFPDHKNIRKSDWLHRQNWLFTEVYLLCFANGVVQCHCRHINNHQFDEGREHKDVTPVIAFSQPDAQNIDRAWTGEQPMIPLGSAMLNLTDCSSLVSPAHPGSLRTRDGLVLFQPYEGVEIGGDSAKLTGTDGLFYRAHERIMPRGVARTVRFTLGLGQAAPVLTRFTVPEWWYAVSGDLWPDCALPVHDAWNDRIDATYEDAVVRREGSGRFDDHCAALSREGETPYAQFIHAYRSGILEHWQRAIRDAYHMADIAFDHATETIRMHNYPFDGTMSPPLFRTIGMLFGYLETGDPYLRECTESASLKFLCLDRQNWPRNSYGRDGASIRGLVFLADYLGSDQYRDWARECLGRLIQCQLPDGSYHDQGGAPGVHAIGQLPIKPWMANLATNPVVDYLQRWPEDEPLWQALLKYGQFLVASGTQRDGTVRWPYQVSYGGMDYDPWKEFFQPGSEYAKLPDQSVNICGYKARTLSVISNRARDPLYFDAWVKFYEKYWANRPPDDRRWSVIKSLYTLPYAQAHAWNAHWRNGRVEIDPVPSLHRTELEGTIQTPRGPVTVTIRRPDPSRADGWKIVGQRGAPGVEVVITGAKRGTERPQAMAGH